MVKVRHDNMFNKMTVHSAGLFSEGNQAEIRK